MNEAAARAFWPAADPLGKPIALGQGGFEDGAEVIGVVSDVRYSAIETAAVPDAYLPILQSPPRAFDCSCRAPGVRRAWFPRCERKSRRSIPICR